MDYFNKNIWRGLGLSAYGSLIPALTQWGIDE